MFCPPCYPGWVFICLSEYILLYVKVLLYIKFLSLRSSVVERITSTSEVYDEVVSSILAEGILFYFLALNAVSFLLFVF